MPTLCPERVESEIEELGFSVLENVVDRAQLEELRQELDLAMAADMREYGHLPGKKEYLIYEMVSRGAAFVRLLENKTMGRVFSHFLGDTWILYSYTSTIMRPRLHQSTAEIHVDSPRIIPGYHSALLMTLAVDDFTERNGATYFLPGSHRSPERPSEEEFSRRSVCACRSAGDVVFFNPRVWHAGGRNDTDETRRGLGIYAVRSFMRQRFDYPRLLTPEHAAQLPERTRAILGFNVRVPTSLEEYYVPESERLYKAGQG